MLLRVGHEDVEVSENRIRDIQRRMHGSSPGLDIRDCPIVDALISHVIKTFVPPTCDQAAPIQNALPTFEGLQSAAARVAFTNPIAADYLMGNDDPATYEAALYKITREIGPKLAATLIAAGPRCDVTVNMARSDATAGTKLEVEVIVRA